MNGKSVTAWLMHAQHLETPTRLWFPFASLAEDRKPRASEAVDMARPLLQQHSTLNSSSRAESFCEGVMSLPAAWWNTITDGAWVDNFTSQRPKPSARQQQPFYLSWVPTLWYGPTTSNNPQRKQMHLDPQGAAGTQKSQKSMVKWCKMTVEPPATCHPFRGEIEGLGELHELLEPWKVSQRPQRYGQTNFVGHYFTLSEIEV
jgi:hypothetical protein